MARQPKWKEKVCECYSIYGEAHKDCTWTFKAKWGWEKFCEPCKTLARKIYMRERMRLMRETYDIDSLPFTACHIDKHCTCCGQKGVPVGHKFLCWDCYTSDYAAMNETVEMRNQFNDMNSLRWSMELSDMIYQEENGPITLYTSRWTIPPEELALYGYVYAGMSQYYLRQLVPSERRKNATS